jgi:hypothetical protein
MPSELEDFDEFPADAVWLQLDHETTEAYQAFCIYRDMGNQRSLRLAAQEYYRLEDLPDRIGQGSAKLRQIQTWSAKYDWGERAGAYTRHLDRIARVQRVEELRQMNERHAAVANLAMSKAAERLRGVSAESLTVRDATVLMDIAGKMERLARGGATEIMAVEDPHATADARLRPILDDPKLALAARDIATAMAQAQAELDRDDA